MVRCEGAISDLTFDISESGMGWMGAANQANGRESPVFVPGMDLVHPGLQHDPNRPEDVLKVDADEEGTGGDDAADACRYLVATKARQ